jgi:hypothetical protein
MHWKLISWQAFGQGLWKSMKLKENIFGESLNELSEWKCWLVLVHACQVHACPHAACTGSSSVQRATYCQVVVVTMHDAYSMIMLNSARLHRSWQVINYCNQQQLKSSWLDTNVMTLSAHGLALQDTENARKSIASSQNSRRHRLRDVFTLRWQQNAHKRTSDNITH